MAVRVIANWRTSRPSTRLDQSQERFLQGAQVSAKCLLRLISNILDVAKIEAGKVELDLIEFNPRHLLEDVVEIMAPSAHRKGLEICCDLSADLPSLFRGDADRLRQIVLNLVNNAVKFTERGQVHLRVRADESDATGMLLRFEVTDTGIGIPEDRQDRLFKLYSQVDASTTRRFGGTGLGLALCQGLVELLGGELGVESRDGKGSTFWFTVRLQPVSGNKTTEVLPGSFRNLRVLVADDNETNLEITSSHLRRWGLDCEAVNSARAALEVLQSACSGLRPYGLAILDMRMPDMDGREFINRIRSTPEIAEVPLVLLTSIGDDIPREQLDAWRIATCLSKPVRQSRLFDSVISATCRIPDCEPEQPAPQSEPPDSLSLCKNLHVLVAENNDINQLVVRELLNRAGLTCILADNGQQAVDLAASRRFDLVLMDCQMPVLDGFAATTTIRRREESEGGWARSGGRLPVVALTANAVAGDREDCLSAGMDDYLAKPLDRKSLLVILKRWLPTAHPAPDRSVCSARHSAQSVVVPEVEPSFDRDAFLERCFGDCEIALELLGMFEDRATSQRDTIDLAIAQGDRERLVSVAHALQGVAGHLSAKSLMTVASRIDREYRNTSSNVDSMLGDVLMMRSEIERCLSDLPQLRQSIARDRSLNSGR
ncbi:MAG: response regulator [Fuerstia sp.]|nr:response regulator [Fuerstiella sp.]